MILVIGKYSSVLGVLTSHRLVDSLSSFSCGQLVFVKSSV